MPINDTINREMARVQEQLPQLPKVDGRVKDYKTPLQKVRDVFFEEDFKTVKESLIKEIIVPTVKNFAADLFIGAIERALFGTTNKRPPSSVIRGGGQVSSLVRGGGTSYGGYYNKPVTSIKSVAIEQTAGNGKPEWPFEDLVWMYKSKADQVRDNLISAAEQYGKVSVLQLYDSITDDDEPRHLDYTEDYWGWTKDTIGDARVTRVAKGWWLQLPKPIQLN